MEQQSVLCLNTKLETIFKKLGKINKKTFWVECLFIPYVNYVSPQCKTTPLLWIDTFAPSYGTTE